VRFANAPAVDVVNDRRDVTVKPRELHYERNLDNFDASFFRLVTRRLELRRHERARGINALDEVPDSTWFTNRIGVRDVTPSEIAAPPGSVGSPEAYKPWTIISSKAGGVTMGFIIEDTRGERFLLKFDPRGFPETETAAQIIVGKLLWAIGYNVTDDYIVHANRADFVLAPDATLRTDGGDAVALDRAELDARLDRIETTRDGTIRGLASRYLDGTPLGGHPVEGVRRDDPNDRIPHELRRDLRGAYVFFEWLDHTDLHAANSLDMWVTDPDDPNRRYVKHYFIDFGIGLGVGATKNSELRHGYEYEVDWGATARTLFSFGLIARPWEDREPPRYRGVGHYDVTHYDPGRWKPLTPMYTPVLVADRIDKLWAAKILMKLERAHIRAAVDAARLTDPRAAAWLTEALIARQRKTARYWFERVSPLDEIRAREGGLCLKDLAIAYSFASERATHYTFTFYDRNGKQLGASTAAPNARGDACGALRLSAGHESYTIVRVETKRPNFAGTTYVHVARDPRTLVPRVIGIWRQ
jgi:hypothetical protein